MLGGTRKLAISLGALGALALAALILLLRPVDAQAVQASAAVAPGNYVGVATCGGTTCHGRSQGDGPRIRQDEIMLWQDPSTAAGAHSRAYAVLREPRSRAMAERLGIGEATGAPMCLGCHATPAGPRGVRFQTTDGEGRVRFTTIYPGAYPGRAVHVHFKVRAQAAGADAEFTSQFYFDDALTDRVHALAPYAGPARRTRNPQDGLYRRGGRDLTLDVTPADGGYQAAYDVGVRAA